MPKPRRLYLQLAATTLLPAWWPAFAASDTATSASPPKQTGQQGQQGPDGAGRYGPTSHLPEPASLPSALAAALAQREPLLLLASLPGCPYCEAARLQHLLGLRQQGVPIYQLNMRSSTELGDMDGRRLTQDQWLRERQIKHAPTLLFVGAGGHEVVERLRGFMADFYGAYLERSLEQARARVRA